MSTVARTEILLLWMQAGSGCCTRRIHFSTEGVLMISLSKYAPVAAACVLAMSVSAGGAAQASSLSEEAGSGEGEFEQQVAVDPATGAQRSAVPIDGEGLRLNTQPGDLIRVEGDTVTWLDGAGGVVATINLSPEKGESVPFTYDETKHLLRPEATRALEDDEYAGCMPKWWGWFFGITWGGLVCMPATAGASGVATPIAGAVTEMACAAAGGALVTAISC